MSDDGAAPQDDAGPSVPSGAISRELPIINKRGLHARASAKFVQMVERFNAEVWVTKGSETVGGNSIMGLMMLSAGPGTSIMVSAIGPEAQAALDAITELVASKFNEEGVLRNTVIPGWSEGPDPESSIAGAMLRAPGMTALLPTSPAAR